jgi:hypothetical protein
MKNLRTIPFRILQRFDVSPRESEVIRKYATASVIKRYPTGFSSVCRPSRITLIISTSDQCEEQGAADKSGEGCDGELRVLWFCSFAVCSFAVLQFCGLQFCGFAVA